MTDRYAYDYATNEPKYRINDTFWYRYPAGAAAAFWQDGKFVYPHPSGSTPRYYAS